MATLELLDPDSPTYALDALSVIEATLDNPRQVLSAQQHKARGEAVAQMKADGMEYEERMDLLDKVTYPKPLEELLEAAYDVYRRSSPWVADYELAPKSVARDMYERAMTFVDYVNFYTLPRSEGLLLRYLADAFKALKHTMPEEMRTDDVNDLIEWLGELVRQVDSSLLDEWEELVNPGEEAPAVTPHAFDEKPPPVTANKRAFRVMVRNELFHRVELAALRNYDALGEMDSASGWDADRWFEAMEEYFDAHDQLGTGPDARGPALLMIDEQPEDRPGVWAVRQIFADPEDHHDWGISAEVDLAASDEAGTAVLVVTDVNQL
jgi:superfamily II RNA helicase